MLEGVQGTVREPAGVSWRDGISIRHTRQKPSRLTYHDVRSLSRSVDAPPYVFHSSDAYSDKNTQISCC
jgi:hypothetical protein